MRGWAGGDDYDRVVGRVWRRSICERVRHGRLQPARSSQSPLSSTPPSYHTLIIVWASHHVTVNHAVTSPHLALSRLPACGPRLQSPRHRAFIKLASALLLVCMLLGDLPFSSGCCAGRRSLSEMKNITSMYKETSPYSGVRPLRRPVLSRHVASWPRYRPALNH